MKTWQRIRQSDGTKCFRVFKSESDILLGTLYISVLLAFEPYGVCILIFQIQKLSSKISAKLRSLSLINMIEEKYGIM